MKEVSVQAKSLGPIALRALSHSNSGEVKAVFDHAFYIVIGQEWICIGDSTLPAGPLNVQLLDFLPSSGIRNLITVGSFVSNGPRLRVGKNFVIDTDRSTHWRPPRVSKFQDLSLCSTTCCLDAARSFNIPIDGLAPILRPDEYDTPITIISRSVINYLHQLISCHSSVTQSIEVTKITPLVGLGPGLTPAGDDFLVGMLVTLRLAGYSKLVNGIWRALVPLIDSRTNAISAAHLRAAAEGYGSNSLHLLLKAIFEADIEIMSERISELVARGHTSGWDALTGVICTLRALADAPILSC
ncbi:MAG: DUF2877 domain-containing protein [Terriglobia bacterium]